MCARASGHVFISLARLQGGACTCTPQKTPKAADAAAAGCHALPSADQRCRSLPPPCPPTTLGPGVTSTPVSTPRLNAQTRTIRPNSFHV